MCELTPSPPSLRFVLTSIDPSAWTEFRFLADLENVCGCLLAPESADGYTFGREVEGGGCSDDDASESEPVFSAGGSGDEGEG